MRKVRHGYGWAWAIEDRGGYSLCHWAEPIKFSLVSRGNPSPDAKPMFVKFVPVYAGKKAVGKKAGRKK